MIRKCPSCGSKNVRRSSTREEEVTWRHGFLSRYRCRDCTLQFWVISKQAYVVAAYVAVAMVVAAIAVILLGMWLDPGTSPGKGPRRSEGGQQQRVLVAGGVRFTPPQVAGAARATPSSAG